MNGVSRGAQYGRISESHRSGQRYSGGMLSRTSTNVGFRCEGCNKRG